MHGVRVERDIRDHTQRRDGFLECAYRTLHQPIGIVGLLGQQALGLCVYHREERDGRHAQGMHFTTLFHQQIDGATLDTGHAGHGFTTLSAFQHEDRQDEVIGRQLVFTHQAAREVVLAHAAHTGCRKLARATLGQETFSGSGGPLP